MPHPLSRASNDWSRLVAAARRWPVVPPSAAQTDDENLNLLLQPPVAVAWWITTFAPALMERRRLDLLVVGVAGGAGVIDQGRPYQLLPLLLECPQMRVEATFLVGSTDVPLAPLVAHPQPAVSLRGGDGMPDKPATMFSGTLNEWVASRDAAPDLCLLMHPSFDVAANTWTGLRALLEAGTTVGCFARSPQKVQRDAWLLEAYGYHVAPDAQPNPWAIRRASSGGHGPWSAVGWHLAPAVLPPADFPIDHERLRRAREAQEFLDHEFTLWDPLQFIGQPYVHEGAAGEQAEDFVGFPDRHVLSLRSGDVWALEADARETTREHPRVPPQVLSTYPAAAGLFERLLWAVETYRDVVLPQERATAERETKLQRDQLRDELTRSLHPDAAEADIARVTEYFQGGTGPTAATPGSEALFAALVKRDWDGAMALVLQQPALANAHDEDGRTPLFYALGARHYFLAQRLLEMDAAPNHLDQEGFAVIHDAAKADQVEALELLHRYGADLDLPTALGFTPATLALQHNRWKALAYLLAERVDLHKTMFVAASVAGLYESIDGLPRVLRSEIDRQLGKRPVIPIMPVGSGGVQGQRPDPSGRRSGRPIG